MTDDSPPPRPQPTSGQTTKAAPVGWEPELEELRLRQTIARKWAARNGLHVSTRAAA